ncbi:hypothetical protein LC55x_2680 [Lysobacter capsici]|nr:hypothetical protein LC55x_2680 [Lysobacter capsici]
MSRRISRAKNFYRESYYATKYAFVVIHLSNARSRYSAHLKASPRSHSGLIEVVARSRSRVIFGETIRKSHASQRVSHFLRENVGIASSDEARCSVVSSHGATSR